MRCSWAVIIGFVTVALIIPAPASATKSLWTIGRADLSSAEFAQAPQPHVVYEVGKSNWAKNWPATQNIGSEYEILFNLAGHPKGLFRLKMDVFAYTQFCIPALEVTINGHRGRFYLNPHATYATLEPRPPSDNLDIVLPLADLQTGSNRLVLSWVNPLTPNKDAMVASGVRYDDLSLGNEEQPAVLPDVTARVTPSIFYRQHGAKLDEVVEAILRFNAPSPAEEASLEISGKSYQAKVPSIEDFGEARLQFEVPEWEGNIPGRLVLDDGQRTFNMHLQAARKWTLFFVPHTHLDIGFTDYVGKVAEIQSRELDDAMRLIQEHPDFRFTTDGSWSVEQYLGTRSNPKQDELLRLAAGDKLGIPANYANLLTGYASLETLYRSLYYSKQISIDRHIPFDYASTNDVPTYSGAYPSILSSAGIQYWAAGPNADRAPFGPRALWMRRSPFWWQGPDGKKVLFWYARGYREIAGIFGLPPRAEAGVDALPIFLQDHNDMDPKVDAVLIDGSQEENVELIPPIATVVDEWNREYAYPRLRYATFPDFFRYIERKFGATLPTYSGEMGSYWEDGVAADALYTAEDRQNQTSALSAEIVSTISHEVDSSLHPMKPELDHAWKDIELYAEHTWRTAGDDPQEASEEAPGHLTVKDGLANDAKFDLENVEDRAMSQLADSIHIPGETLVVFNPLNWKRNALVETPIREGSELVDLATGNTVPMEQYPRPQGQVDVRFLARDIPPVGYRCFQIRPAPRHESLSSPRPGPIDRNTVVENQFYRVTLDPETGSIKSILDKQLHQELVDASSPYKFGQYLYVTGGDGQTRIVWSHEDLPLAKLTIHPAAQGSYLGFQKTSWGDSIRLRGSDTNTPEIDLEIRLFDREKKIELSYTVQKQYTSSKEGVYFAFPIASPSPRFLYTNQQGWVDPATDMLQGACLEWFAVQHWMAQTSPRATVAILPVDAPLASFGDINRGEWPTTFHPATSTIFSYVMNNYWHTNYPPGQGGVFTFRYVITSAAHLDPAALSRMSWDSREPVVLDHVTRQDKLDDPSRPLPATGTSFLETSTDSVVLVTWKLAEDGQGTILRLMETAGKASTITVVFPHSRVRAAKLCNAVEDNVRDLDVRDNHIQLGFQPHEILAIRLLP